MGNLLFLVAIILGAICYFLARLSGNRKAAEEDELIAGSAWFFVLAVGFVVSFVILFLIRSYLRSLEQPIRIIAQIITGLIIIYLPFKVADLIVPLKNRDKR